MHSTSKKSVQAIYLLLLCVIPSTSNLIAAVVEAATMMGRYVEFAVCGSATTHKVALTHSVIDDKWWTGRISVDIVVCGMGICIVK